MATTVRLLSLVLLFAAGQQLVAVEPKSGEFAAETITVGKATRVYRLVVPKSVDLPQPAPLIVSFHGMGIDRKDFMPWYTDLSKTAEKLRSAPTPVRSDCRHCWESTPSGSFPC